MIIDWHWGHVCLSFSTQSYQGFSWVLPGFSMGSTRVFHGFYQGLSWVLSGFSMGSTRVFHGSYQGFSWVLSGFFMGSTRVFHGFYQGFSWVLPGSFMGSTRVLYHFFFRPKPGCCSASPSPWSAWRSPAWRSSRRWAFYGAPPWSVAIFTTFSRSLWAPRPRRRSDSFTRSPTYVSWEKPHFLMRGKRRLYHPSMIGAIVSGIFGWIIFLTPFVVLRSLRRSSHSHFFTQAFSFLIPMHSLASFH